VRSGGCRSCWAGNYSNYTANGRFVDADVIYRQGGVDGGANQNSEIVDEVVQLERGIGLVGRMDEVVVRDVGSVAVLEETGDVEREVHRSNVGGIRDERREGVDGRGDAGEGGVVECGRSVALSKDDSGSGDVGCDVSWGSSHTSIN